MHSQYSIDLRSLFLCIDCLTNLLLQVKHSRIGTHLQGHIGLHRMPSCGFVDFLYPHKVPWFIIGSSLDKNGLVYTTIPCVYIYVIIYIYILLYIINYICHIYIYPNSPQGHDAQALRMLRSHLVFSKPLLTWDQLSRRKTPKKRPGNSPIL